MLFKLKIRLNSEILRSLGAPTIFFYIYEDDNDGDDVFDNYETDGDDVHCASRRRTLEAKL